MEHNSVAGQGDLIRVRPFARVALLLLSYTPSQFIRTMSHGRKENVSMAGSRAG